MNGFGAVAAEGLYASPPGRIVLESQSTWTQTAEITGAASEDLSIVLSITAPRLQIQDFADVGVGVNENIARYELELTLDGSPIFGSSATFRGGRAGNTLSETGTDLGGTRRSATPSTCRETTWSRSPRCPSPEPARCSPSPSSASPPAAAESGKHG